MNYLRIKLLLWMSCAIIVLGCSHKGGTITVKNIGLNMLDSLRLEIVDGKTYHMGNLPPGETKSIKVHIVGRPTVHLIYSKNELLKTTTLFHQFSGTYIVTVTSDSSSNSVESTLTVN